MQKPTSGTYKQQSTSDAMTVPSQQLPKQTKKVSLPKPYEFNHTIGLDVNYLDDAEGTPIEVLNVLCTGTKLQIEWPLREGKGTPASKLCYDMFMEQWVNHYGFPKVIRCDRGLHNMGHLLQRARCSGSSGDEHWTGSSISIGEY